ncbi:hypothetical protein CANMA_003744 [Candida margitis]|uniref:uncharacterized protein n=1 Tax=Candida margitis TaxID=1775924 RepID=UPI002227C9AF|nr:uncharacterized protein CANMA_003744 [Candida margitis]KAI5961767.1 hypothetical protein CANMA_003744 [Candida margitis]
MSDDKKTDNHSVEAGSEPSQAISMDIDKVDTTNGEQDNGQESSQMSLPMSKIKKIFKMDPDFSGASQGAVYATGLATELFVQYFVEQASLMAKVDKRKKIQYKDFANAVSSHDALNFLGDTIPKTYPIGDLIQKKKVNTIESIQQRPSKPVEDSQKSSNASSPKVSSKQDPVLPKGQQILNFGSTSKKETPVKKAGINDLVSASNEGDIQDVQDIVMKE